MQLPEPAHGHAIRHYASCTVRVQPRGRHARIRREAVKVNRPRLESGNQLLHRALHVVEVHRARRVQRALLGQASRFPKGKPRPLVHFVRRAGKYCSQLKEPHIADVAMQIACNHPQHSRHQRRAQHTGLFTERIAERHSLPRLRSGERGLGCRTECA